MKTVSAKTAAARFESRFHPDSFGFRPERNCHQAIERISELWRQGYFHVLDADSPSGELPAEPPNALTGHPGK